MTKKERECITKGSILGTYLIVCLEWIKGWEWTKCHLDELLGSPMQEIQLTRGRVSYTIL